MSTVGEARIAVLGATGPVGEEVIRVCLDRGHRPLAISRNAAKLDELAARHGVETVRVDARDRAALARLAQGVDAFVVTAGVAADALVEQVEMARAIVEVGSGRVRLVYVSSCWSYAPLQQPMIREDHPRSGDGPAGYRREAEDLFAAAGGLVLHLPDFYGPRVHTSPLQRLIQRAVAGRTLTWPARPNVVREHAFIRDLGAPIVGVIESAREAPSRHLIVGGSGPIDFRQMVGQIRESVDRPIRAVSLGRVPAAILVRIDPWSRHLGQVIGEYRKPVAYGASLLHSFIGPSTPTSYREGIRTTAEWLNGSKP